MKEEYIIMRNKGKYDINWFYRYYLSKGGKEVDMHTFHSIFAVEPLQQIIDKLDKDYGLTGLYDRNNKLIKVWQ